MSAPTQENRRAIRQRLRLQLRYWNDQLDSVGYTSDVSITGMFVQTRRLADVGTRLHIEVTLPHGSFMCEGVVARIVQTSAAVESVTRSGLGVRFVSLMEVIRTLQPAGTSGPSAMLEVRVTDASSLQQLWLRELVHGGVFITTPDPPARDAQVAVRFVLPPPHEPLEVRGTVVHVSKSPPGAAVQFATMDRLRSIVLPLLPRPPGT